MMLSEHMIRPYSRKYDREEHTPPTEMEEVAKLIRGGREGLSGGKKEKVPEGTIVNGGNLGSVTGLEALGCQQFPAPGKRSTALTNNHSPKKYENNQKL